MEIEISNEVEISNKVDISNQNVRETQPSSSGVGDQLREYEAESGPLYSWRECNVIT